MEARTAAPPEIRTLNSAICVLPAPSTRSLTYKAAILQRGMRGLRILGPAQPLAVPPTAR